MKFKVGDILFITIPLQTYEVLEISEDSYILKNQRGDTVKFVKSSADELFTKLVDIE